MGRAAKLLTGLSIFTLGVYAVNSGQEASSDPQRHAFQEAVLQSPSSPASDLGNAQHSSSVTVSLEAGDVLILGSLDTSAACHRVTLTVADSASSPSNSNGEFLVVAADSISRIDLRGDKPSFVADAVSEIARPRQVAEPKFRRFKVPYFSADDACDRFIEAPSLVETQNVRIYTEATLLNSDSSATATKRLADTVCETLETGLREYVEQRVGELSDIDGDGRLSILLCHLCDERLPGDELNTEPILGCVRGADFNLSDPFSGDIVYLDIGLANRSDLVAILGHELAHAAVFSQCSNDDLTIPGWLNEAIAHKIEIEVCPSSQNFARRLDAFLRQTDAFPVFSQPGFYSATTQRGGTRAAGCTFLSAVLEANPDVSLKQLICCGESRQNRFDKLGGYGFAEIFRSWAVGVVKTFPEAANRTLTNGRVRILGTAFHAWASESRPRTVKVDYDPTAKLQVTVVRQTPNLAEIRPQTSPR